MRTVPMDLEMGDGHTSDNLPWSKADVVRGISFAGRDDGSALAAFALVQH